MKNNRFLITICFSILFFNLHTVLPASPELSNPGTEKIVEYEKYGRFENPGTLKYKYKIMDQPGLAAAIGEGIFPDTTSVFKDPEYLKALRTRKLEGNQWDFINTDDHMTNFYKWATINEDPGVKLYYTALALEKAGEYEHALKAYYAVIVMFPRAVGWTYWHTPLYMSKLAYDRIDMLLRKHPELGMKMKNTKVDIINGFDNDLKNDKFLIDPGYIVECNPDEVIPPRPDLSKLKSIETRGGDYVKLVKYENGHWQMFVDGKPFIMKAMAYSPNVVGRSPEFGTLTVHKDWQLDDLNKNGKIDGFFDSWIDKNANNIQDADEPVIGDATLLREMGCNVIRCYHGIYNKELFRKLKEDYGIYAIVGNYIGVYAVDSGATWLEGTDYTNPDQKKNMLKSVRDMVEDLKDEDFIIMWVLGNENNYGNANNSQSHPEAYYSFANEAAKLIHELDPMKRPVAICNGDVFLVDKCAEFAPDIDVYGSNCYRGTFGFGNHLWSDIKNVYDRPVLITEYGCSAYFNNQSLEYGEEKQMLYHKGNWEDIAFNAAGESGEGNAIGGVVYEWADEWWKRMDLTDAAVQDTIPSFGAPMPDGWSHEEWLGITSQGDGKNSPFYRRLRPTYFYYKELWNKD